MTTQSQQDSEPGRKFDDIASLFGAIVPPPGSPVRPGPRLRPLPVALPEPTSPPVIPSPPAMPALVADQPIAEEPEAPAIGEAPLVAPPATVSAAPGTALPPPPPLRVEPPALARPRPTEIPWPDAFEPRPNFKKSEPRNWSWLLLIPAGIVAAIGISMVDTRAIRGWVDTNVLHRSPTTGSIDDSLLPAPFRSQAPTSQSPTSQADPNPAAPVDATQADASNPYPAIPTSPVPVPPGVVVSPPPVDATQQAGAAAVPVHVTIQYRRNIPGADGEARRIAALLQSTGGSVELRPGGASVKVPTITYYNAADKPAATALASVLVNEAASWSVQLGTAKNPPGSLDIWMP